jgi:hypothetical protein
MPADLAAVACHSWACPCPVQRHPYRMIVPTPLSGRPVLAGTKRIASFVVCTMPLAKQTSRLRAAPCEAG